MDSRKRLCSSPDKGALASDLFVKSGEPEQYDASR
jgi:hypothetical protein